MTPTRLRRWVGLGCAVAAVAALSVGLRLALRAPWPQEKWPDFWIVLVASLLAGLAAVIIGGSLATVVATLYVEGRLQRFSEQRDAVRRREEDELQRSLFVRRAVMELGGRIEPELISRVGVPGAVTALDRILANAPPPGLQAGAAKVDVLFWIKMFEIQRPAFDGHEASLRERLRERIDDYDRQQAKAGRVPLRDRIPIEVQDDFCLRLLVAGAEVEHAKQEAERTKAREQQIDADVASIRLGHAVEDLAWRLRLATDDAQALEAVCPLVAQDRPLSAILKHYVDTRHKLLLFAEEVHKSAEWEDALADVRRLNAKRAAGQILTEFDQWLLDYSNSRLERQKRKAQGVVPTEADRRRAEELVADALARRAKDSAAEPQAERDQLGGDGAAPVSS